jgi:protein SCO1
MTKTPARPPRTVWIGFVLLFALLALSFTVWFVQIARKFSPPLPVIGRVAPFTLTSQESRPVSLADFTNRVWLADIIFTRCAGPCPRLTQQMRQVQDALPKECAAKLVTLTTDPEFDTPSVLKKYGEHFGADFSRWTFFTGTKSEIAAVAASSLKLSAQPVKPEEQKDSADLFIHTTIFVLVDKHAQLRGFFETGGDGVDWTNAVLPRIMRSVRQLDNEP